MTTVLERTAGHIHSGREVCRPGNGPPRTLGATLPALCVLAVCLAAPVQSHAQSNGAQSNGALSNRKQSDQIQGAWRNGASAAQLYGDAQDDIGAGRLDAAVRNLEELIERHPYTSLAKRSRAKLRRLYAKQNRGGNAVPGPIRVSPRRASRNRTGSGTTSPLKAGKLRITVRRVKPARRAKSKPTFNDAFKIALADRVFFGQDSVGLGARARAVVTQHAKWLKAHPHLTIILNAHADENGTAAFNKSLSRRRAAAVRDLLLERGVGSQRIKIAAHGRAKPVSRCKTAGCAAQNRRVVADVVLSGGNASTIATASAPAAAPAPVPARRNR